MMAEENKKLEAAVAAGEGNKHSIEVDDSEETADGNDNDAVAEKDGKQLIEMNFALGLVESSDADSDDDDDKENDATAMDIDQVAAVAKQKQQGSNDEAFKLLLGQADSKPRPVIQELN
ncbi:TPA: hypothetical protein N0F65_002963 [Lagenidium giganteum]|uniref:Nascent polypeptide-associated complex subunit alpha-like UBA domain-containing protein n=1 Tax=Lagenidium giganteum TaxID=4803 RepID=A0AAV2YQZ7_9STRA|nr:TPA: hypothetical protein N0F65_002963 [Lagenidium giganteum]